MRRFPPREPPRERRLRREQPRPEGPFDRLLRRRPERDPAPIIIGGTIGFLALVIVLVLAFSSLFGGGGNDNSASDTGSDSVSLGSGITARRAQIPALPPGLAAQSEYYQFDAQEDVPIALGLPLISDTSDTAGLGFYTYFDNRWQRLAEVKEIKEFQGKKVGQTEFTKVPKNLAILRVLAQTYQVAGSLPQNGALHPDARVNIVSPRDYVPAADGSVQGQATLVPSQQALLMPTIVGSTQDTAAIVNDILKDESLRSAHVGAIAKLVTDGGFAGIDLEYSSVDSKQGDDFSDFVKSLADRLHGNNKRLSLTLPPPSSTPQAYNWNELGKAVDIIKVLPLADPTVYWQTMPSALSQLIKDVDPGKVMLVVNPFSIEGTGDVSRPIGYLQAIAIAAEGAVRDPSAADIKPGVSVKLVAKNLDEGEGASPLRWDNDGSVVSFALGGAERHRIFIENSYSVSFKLEMVQAYRLGGVAVADASAGSDVANVWGVINGLVQSATVSLARPNDTTLQPSWQAPDGGDIGAGTGTSATWVAPQAGKYNIILVVSDGEHRFGRKLPLEVNKGNEPAATPLVTFPPETVTPSPAPAASATPTPAPSTSGTPSASTLKLQVGKRADGDDPDSIFSDPEQTSAGSDVTYRIVIDNDSPVPVTIQSIVDNVYPGVTCKNSQGNDVIGLTLAPDDGDKDVATEQGDDAAVCKFTKTVSQSVTDTVTVTVTDGTHTASDSDSAEVDVT